MNNDFNVIEIESDAAPPVLNIQDNFVTYDQPEKPKKKNEEDKWEYYSKDKNFLLRFGLIKIPGTEDLIRFEVLNTETISEKYEMFAGFFKREKLIKELEITQKKIDVYTFIFMLFETNPPKGKINKDSNEFELIITKNDGKKYLFPLKNEMCEDDSFFSKNMRKKMEQLENYLDIICLNFENENKELNNKNEELEKELNKIKTLNINMEKNNDLILKALQNLENYQNKAITHLNKLKN